MMHCEVTWLGQAGYLLDFGGVTLCVDPYLSNSVEEIEGLKRLVPPPIQPEELRVSYLLVTHDHLDHLDLPSLRRIADPAVQYVGPKSCMDCLDWVPSERRIILERGESVSLGDLSVEAVFAAHTADSVGFLIQPPSGSGGIYLTGDSLYDPQLLKLRGRHPAVLIACINGKLGNMDYQQAARLACELGVHTAIPCHYGMFAENTEDPEKFALALASMGIRCVTLPLGEPSTIEF